MARTRTMTTGTAATSRKGSSGRPKARKAAQARPSGPVLSPAVRQLALLGGVLTCAYATVALISYKPTDPAFSRSSGGEVENLAGPVGAWVADLLHVALGHGAWAVVLVGVLLARRLAGRPGPGLLRVLGGAALLWSVTCALALLLSHDPATTPFPPGGLLGLFGSNFLVGLVGPAGAWLVLVGLALGALTITARLDLERLSARVLGRVERDLPRVGAASFRMGRQAVGGMVSAGAAVAERVRTLTLDAPADDHGGEDDGGEDDDEEDDPELDDPADDYTGIETSDPDLDRTETGQAWVGLAPVGVPPVVVDVADEVVPTQAGPRELVEVEYVPTEAGLTVSEPPEAPLVAVEPADPDPASASAPPLVPTALDPLDAPDPASLPGVAAAEPPRPPKPPASEAERQIDVTPGNLVSGGDDDGGLAIVDRAAARAFELPHLGLLDAHERDVAQIDEAGLRELASTLESKLADFGVKGEVAAIRPGPVITTFEYLPAPGIKIARIAALTDDIAMALKALRVRIVAPIPGKGVVGIEIPNRRRQTVWIRDIIGSKQFRKAGAALPLALGRSVEGLPRIADLAKMPHLLIGGTTGSGKSVGVNAMLLSLLYTRTPEELRLILVDPKMLEFELYRDIPHLLHPVVTDPKLASAALKWACTEMDERYKLLSRWQARNISSYNRKIEQELEDWTPAKALRYAPESWPEGEPPPPRKLPYIVVVIDELSDLMMVAAKDVEESIIRLAQKARAAGIHVVVATQRPSVNVITGLIKANMPSRVSYQVRTKVDSRTILDQNGAETLLGKGDALYLPPGVSGLERVHGPFCSDEEVRRVTEFLRQQGEPDYEADIRTDDDDLPGLTDDEYDELYDHAVAYVVQQGKASSSMIQREFKIGYNRAARMLEIMEREGVVGPADGARPRDVLIGQH